MESVEKNIILKLKSLTKSFGSVKVLMGINLDVYKGEFITLLGPSGCGKTTTLRLIAGLESCDLGEIYLNGEDITALPPEQRRVNTVFQNYALFPHMNVYNNIAYGLKVKKIGAPEIKKRVARILEQVRMEGMEKRMPNELSGGQRQRIAIGRALVNEPEILLLDEPLGALDLKLRRHMQSELKAMQERFNITFVYVTHDQDEALNMSDRIIVMDKGRIMQQGTPKEIYNKPANMFVAGFIGEQNILPVSYVKSSEEKAVLLFDDREVLGVNLNNISSENVAFAAIHSDKMKISREKPEGFFLTGKIVRRQYRGAGENSEILLDGGIVIKAARYGGESGLKRGDLAYIYWDYKDLLVLEGGEV